MQLQGIGARLQLKMLCESCGHENVEGARFCAKCGIAITHKSEEDAWVGKVVGGRFRVTRVLGEGGMGIVYAGEQQMGSTVRKVAIKTLHKHLSHDPAILARFHRECGTVAQLEHPNTIKVYDFGAESDGTLYIAMEFVEGRSLDKVIESEAPLSPSRVIGILRQVCGALDEAHNLGIVHRDLKPENVVLGERLGKTDFVKLLDFGIAARRDAGDAKKEQKLTQQGMVLGTPPYMSPEQFTGQELDRRSDVYSLGIMTYEMLTGRLPFSADTPWQWATEHMTAQPFPIDQIPAATGVPETVASAVMRSLSKDPNRRPPTAGALLADLEAALSGHVSVAAVNVARTEAMQAAPSLSRPLEEAPVPEGSSVRRTDTGMSATAAFEVPKKSKTPLFVVAALGVLTLGGAGWFLSRGPSSSSGAVASASSSASSAPPVPSASVPAATASAPEPSAIPSTTASAEVPAPTASTITPPPVVSSGGSTVTKPPVKPPVVTPPPPKESAETCKDAVAAGSWSRASAMFSKLSSADQGQCRTAARLAAPEQIKSAGSDCKRVKSIGTAAKAMGANSSRVEAALKACQ